MKTILILSAGNEAIFGIKRAKDLGYKVVGLDGNPEAPGFAFVDEKLLHQLTILKTFLKKFEILIKKSL